MTLFLIVLVKVSWYKFLPGLVSWLNTEEDIHNTLLATVPFQIRNHDIINVGALLPSVFDHL